MEYLKVKNWDRWQSYRSDRGQPPWIKIHRCIMRNPEWVSLSDSERGQLISVWLLAADRDGLIPSDPTLLQKLCFMSDKINISNFIDLGFIENDSCRSDAKVTSKRRQPDPPEKRREEKSREEIYAQFEKFWNIYPKKKSKGKAEKAFFKIHPDERLLIIMLTVIGQAKKTEDWMKDNGKFIPYPASWLNAKGWEDELKLQGTHKDPYASALGG